ncbi:MAG: PD40 domain-containing protein [Phycisphaerae bacterium]|nr:PD40 domain-containing protein [Phycisphaerae bacterium]
MKWFNDQNMRFALVAVLVALAVGGGSSKADFTFGEPINLGPNDEGVGSTVNLNCSHDYSPCISADGLELYFTSTRTGQQGCIFGDRNIWVSTRPMTEDGWGPPQKLGPPVNTSGNEGSAAISSDGLEMYFERWYSDADSALHASIWVSRRTSQSDPWDEPTQLDLLGDGEENEGAPALSADGLELYFTYADFAGRIGKLYVAKRETIDSPWSQPVSIGPAVNDYGCQAMCKISSDGLVLVFNDWWNCPSRPDGFGERDIWLTRRATRESEWEPPVNLGPLVNTAFSEYAPMISADGSTLYFGSNRCGGSGWGNYDLWQAPILPAVDFDGDGTVGMSEVLAMIDAWGTDDRLCDIGPMPWGDGVVDEADLEVLMGHWGQEVTIGKPELVAHWAFDETEGTTAHDTAGTYDANLIGDPVWQPNGGIAGGALEFDGADDYVDTSFQFDPGGSFSVFVWVRGGGLNQVIVALTPLPILLQADHIEGNLMTAFMFYTDDFLFSQTQVIDGQWHHVGLVWDASDMTRTLYVDGIEVAQGTVTKCPNGSSRLQIGTWDNTPMTGLWSGLIDDVRVYKGALSAEQIEKIIQ